MAAGKKILRESIGETLRNLQDGEREGLQERVKGMAREELTDFLDGMDPDSMGFSGEEAPTYGDK